MTPDELEKMVATMRRLGVLECNGIKLGTPPAPPPKEETREEMEARLEAEKRKRDDVLFAATSIRPA